MNRIRPMRKLHSWRMQMIDGIKPMDDGLLVLFLLEEIYLRGPNVLWSPRSNG